MSTKTIPVLIKLSQVQDLIPYSKASIYRLMGKGKFPKPINFESRAVFWVQSDIEDFIQDSIQRNKE